MHKNTKYKSIELKNEQRIYTRLFVINLNSKHIAATIKPPITDKTVCLFIDSLSTFLERIILNTITINSEIKVVDAVAI